MPLPFLHTRLIGHCLSFLLPSLTPLSLFTLCCLISYFRCQRFVSPCSVLLRCFIFFYLESLYQLSTQRVSSIGLLHVRPTALSRSIVWFRENYLASVAHTLKVLPFQSVISNSWMHQKAFRRLKGNMGPLLENREGIHFVKYCTPVSRYCIACLCVFVRGQFMKIRQNNKGILTLKSVNHSNSHTATQANQFHVN